MSKTEEAGLPVSHPVKRPAPAEEPAQQNGRATADQAQDGNAHQQLAGLLDLRLHRLRNRRHFGFVMHRLEQSVAVVGNGIAAHDHHQRPAIPHLERRHVGVIERFGPGWLCLAAGLQIRANRVHLRVGDLRRGVIDERERGRRRK